MAIGDVSFATAGSSQFSTNSVGSTATELTSPSAQQPPITNQNDSVVLGQPEESTAGATPDLAAMSTNFRQPSTVTPQNATTGGTQDRELGANVAQTGSGTGMLGTSVGAPRTPGGSWARSNGSPLPTNQRVNRLMGSDPRAGQPDAFTGAKGQTAEDLISRVPKNGTRAPFQPSANVQDGMKLKFQNNNGESGELRLHSADSGPHAGPNSQQGWVARVNQGKLQLNGDNNTFVKPNVFNERSPSYDPAAANGSHIPIKGNPTVGGGVEPPPASEFGRLASRGGGALALGGAGFQAKTAYDEFQAGDKVNGTVDAAGATLNGIGGTALLVGGTTASTVVAPLALGGAATIDGVRQGYQGYQAGNKEQMAVGGAKGLGGTLMMAGGATALTGFGAVPGAIMFAGGGVLYAGASIYDSRHAIGNALSKYGEAMNAAAQYGLPMY